MPAPHATPFPGAVASRLRMGWKEATGFPQLRCTGAGAVQGKVQLRGAPMGNGAIGDGEPFACRGCSKPCSDRDQASRWVCTAKGQAWQEQARLQVREAAAITARVTVARKHMDLIT